MLTILYIPHELISDGKEKLPVTTSSRAAINSVADALLRPHPPTRGRIKEEKGETRTNRICRRSQTQEPNLITLGAFLKEHQGEFLADTHLKAAETFQPSEVKTDTWQILFRKGR